MTQSLQTKLAAIVAVLILTFVHGLIVKTYSQRTGPLPASNGYTSAGAAYGSFPLDGFANVNEFSGNLSTVLPLTASAGRGDTSFAINLRIEGTPWSVRHLDFSYPGASNPMYHIYAIDGSTTVRKPGFSPGLVILRRSGALEYGNYAGGPWVPTRRCATLSRLTFTSSDGNEVQLVDRSTNGEPNGVNPNPTQGGPVYLLGDTSIPLNRGSIFDSKDGSNMTFVTDQDVVDVQCPELTGTADSTTIYPSGTLYLANGTQYHFDKGYVTQIIDRNGNISSLEYLTVNGVNNGKLSKVTDSIGRATSIDYSATQTTISTAGFNGASRIVKVYYQPIQNVMRSDQQPQSGAQLFPQIYHLLALGGNVNGGDTNSHGNQVSAIELPNGQQYHFLYNSYGEIARIELPTGGAYEYDYTGQYSWNGDDYGDTYGVYETGEIISRYSNTQMHDWAISRRLLKCRRYNSDNVLETDTSYHSETYAPGATKQEKLRKETRDNQGDLIELAKLYFNGIALSTFTDTGRTPIAYDPPFEGRQLRTEQYKINGTLITSDDTTFEQTGTITKPQNERVSSVSSTLADENLVSKKTFAYDQFGNLSDTYFYDYGPGLPGTLLRREHSDFLSDPNYTDYTASHLIGLESDSWVSSDAAGSLRKSLSRFEYDNYTADATSKHANLLPRNNVFGFDSVNRGPAFVIRGNPTAVTSYTDAQAESGPVSSYSQYDVLGNVVKTIDAKGYASTIDYSDRFGLGDNEAQSNKTPSQLNGLSAFAFPGSVTNPLGWTTYSQFDYFTGKPVNTEAVNGLVSAIAYNDPLDRVTQTVTAVSTSAEKQTTVAYGDLGHQVQTTSDLNKNNDNLLKSVMYYDGFGRTIDIRNYEANGDYKSVETHYDPAGRPYRRSNPYRPTEIDTGHPIAWTTSSFDSLGRTTTVTTPDGAVVRTAYDGDRVLVTDQAGKQRISRTNAIGQLKDVWEVTGADQWTEAISFPTEFSTPAPAAGYKTSYSYDALNNLISVSQGSQSPRSFSYNSLSRLTSAANPESGTIEYDYDQNGNLISKADARGVVTAYEYDELDRQKFRSYSNEPSGQAVTPNVTYTYDDLPNSKGKLTKVESSISKTEYISFDIQGRVTGSRQTTDGVIYGVDDPANGKYPMTYNYNLSGALVEQQYPSGRVVKNSVDSNGDLATVKSKKVSASPYLNYASNFTYNAVGDITSMELGNLNWESTVFNSRMQPEHINLGKTSGASNLLKLDYTYGSTNNNGNILSQTITVPGLTASFFQTYGYDSLNRLSNASETNNSANTWQQVFKFDRYGNRNFVEESTTTLPKTCGTTLSPTVCPADQKVLDPSIDVTNNRLATSDGYAFDGSGNTVGDAQGRTFVYDAENKQTKVEILGTPITVIGEYFYDGDGKRVKKKVGTEVTIFVYDAVGKQIAEYSTTVGNSTDAKVNYITNDHLGSPRINTDREGQVKARHDYHPFGEEISTSQRLAHGEYSGDSVRKRFTGYESDDETALDFAQARYFKNSLGRFYSSDPFNIILEVQFQKDRSKAQSMLSGFLLSTGRWNRYVYVVNNPIMLSDPTGLDIMIIENHATGSNGGSVSNPAGHTAIAVTGYGVFSMGNAERADTSRDNKNNILGGSVRGYIDRELSRRDTTIIIIKTTKEQDAAIVNELKNIASSKGALNEMGILSDNCAIRVNTALDAGKVGTSEGMYTSVPGNAGNRAVTYAISNGQTPTIFDVPQNSNLNQQQTQLIRQFEPRTSLPPPGSPGGTPVITVRAPSRRVRGYEE